MNGSFFADRPQKAVEAHQVIRVIFLRIPAISNSASVLCTHNRELFRLFLEFCTSKTAKLQNRYLV